MKKNQAQTKLVMHCFYNILKSQLVYYLQRSVTYYHICSLKYLDSSFGFWLVNLKTLKRNIKTFSAFVIKKPKQNPVQIRRHIKIIF